MELWPALVSPSRHGRDSEVAEADVLPSARLMGEADAVAIAVDIDDRVGQCWYGSCQ